MSFFRCELKVDSTASAIDTADMISVIEVMKPKASPVPLIRIGTGKDGTYLVPDDFDGIRAIFSPGVNNYKDFEDYMCLHYGMSAHMCDKSSDVEKFRTPLIEGQQTFRKCWLDTDGSADSVSLEDWVREEAPDPRDDLILQMDIEGAEYRNFLNTPRDVLKRFRMMVLEIHGLGKIIEPDVFYQVVKPFFDIIGRDFVSVHAHPNNCGGDFMVPGTEYNMPRVIEVTFLRRDRLDARAGMPLHPPLVPHPLDIARNVAHKPPVFLNAAWSDGTIAPEAEIKRLHDELDYERLHSHLVETACRSEGDDLAASLHRMSQRMFHTFLDTGHAAAGDERQWIEVAQGKPFLLSRSYPGLPDSGVVGYKSPFFFHTAVGPNAAITIDLGQVWTVRKVSVSNRTDTCFDRARLLFCLLRVTLEDASAPAFPLDTTEAFLSGEQAVSDTVMPPTPCRYVTIVSPARTALHFSDVKVFAQPEAAKRRR